MARRYILKERPMDSSDGLDVECEREGEEGDDIGRKMAV